MEKLSKKKLARIAAIVTCALASVGCLIAAGCHKKPADPQGRTYYVSPDGTSDAAGTQDDPLDLYSVLNTKGEDNEDFLKAGDTVMVLPGDYVMAGDGRITMTASGTYNKPITIKNADPTKKATIKFYEMAFASTNRGVQIYGDYCVWDSIDICGAGDNGLYIGGSYNIVQNCEFYDNRDTGLQLGRSYSEYEDISQWPHYNLIKNCTSYNNYDNETYGENADGFAAKLTVGYGNVFDGCIAYRNSDDGWDLYAKTDSGNIGQVIMYNCVAYENGFIMETQASFNAKFPNFKAGYAEAVTASYTTRDGDGNGFKLGGSTMEGEVYLENCLSFHNRMHGVTDNSNPGVITITGVTSYNNGASVNNDSSSAEFGYIKYGSNGADESANIDLARQTYSYNHVANTLSVATTSNTNINPDAYRGTVENSKFYGRTTSKDDKGNDIQTAATFTVEGQEEYNTKTGDRGVAGDLIVDTAVFKTIPAMNLGITEKAHTKFRNEDLSINMGDLLAQKNESSTYGSFVNKTSWEDYTHYDYVDLSSCSGADNATATAVQKMLYVPIRTEACYQDFKAVTKMLDADITWESSDSSVLEVTGTKGTSNSKHEDVKIKVLRPEDADKKVTLTATVTKGDTSLKKSFEINVKQNTYRIGDMVIEGLDKNNALIVDKQATLTGYRLPAPAVLNDTSNSGAIIDPNLYTRTQSCRFAQSSAPDTFTDADRFDPTQPGIWEITVNVTFKANAVKLAKSEDGSGTAPDHREMVYRIYIADRGAQVAFNGEPTVVVNKNGFSIEGPVTSPTGKLYTYTVEKDATAPTAEEIVEKGKEYEFRATSIFHNVEQSNDAAYDIYYVMKNLDGEITTTPGKIAVGVQTISSKAEFEAMLANNNSTTIYKLTQDIDFEGTLNTSATDFVGTFNGMGYTLKNVKLTNTTDTAHKDIPGEGIFKQVRGGTIMNVKFENIVIEDVGPKTGIISLMYGGYVSNVKIHNVKITSSQRVGGLIGQVIAKGGSSSTTYIDRIELINDIEYEEVVNVYKQSDTTVKAEDFANGNSKYYIEQSGNYVLATAFDASATYYVLSYGADATHFERGRFYELVDEEYVLCNEYKENTTFYEKKWRIVGDRSGGIVGFIQAGSDTGYNLVYISDCYVDSRIESGDYCGGIVGRSDDRNKGIDGGKGKDELYISNCYFNGEISCLKRAGGMLGGFTGSGTTRIDSCISIGRLYYADPREVVVVAQKNCSGIIGNYAGNADMLVTNCLASFEEYNSSYEVEVAIREYLRDKRDDHNHFTANLKWDMENIWEFVLDDNGNQYAAPYVKLR